MRNANSIEACQALVSVERMTFSMDGSIENIKLLSYYVRFISAKNCKNIQKVSFQLSVISVNLL